MEDNTDFTRQLGDKLQSYAKDLEKNVLPSLKTDFYNFNASFTTILNILKKKGLLADDPYQYESKISEISPISTDSFLEGEKSTVMSIRLSSYHHQMAFLNDFYQFSLDFLGLSRLKNINAFVRFVRWDALTENCNEINTKVLAEIIGRVRKGDDTISSGLLNDAVNQLSGIQAKIADKLKKITIFKREDYKYTIRVTFLESLGFTTAEIEKDLDLAVRRLKKEFANHIKGQPFVPELIQELLNEEYSTASPRLREDLLKKVSIKEAVTVKPRQERNFKAELMEAVRTLSTANIPMDAALRKLRESSAVMEDRVIGMSERMKIWVKALMGFKKQKLFYEVEYFDTASSSSRKEVIEFEKFTEELYARIRILANMANRQSTVFQVLLLKEEDAILEWYDRTFVEISKYTERINALDAYFKTEVSKEKRQLIKGVKTEIGSIKLALSNANKLKHEYVADKEEVEQLKRLGIKAN